MYFFIVNNSYYLSLNTVSDMNLLLAILLLFVLVTGSIMTVVLILHFLHILCLKNERQLIFESRLIFRILLVANLKEISLW